MEDGVKLWEPIEIPERQARASQQRHKRHRQSLLCLYIILLQMQRLYGELIILLKRRLLPVHMVLHGQKDHTLE